MSDAALRTSRSPQLVVGYDGSPASEEALTVAAGLADRLGAALQVVHVIDLDDYPVDPDAADWEEQAEGTLADEHNRVGELLDSWTGTWSYHLERGDPVAGLSRLADEHAALMIVVGTRGGGAASALQRLLDGSVSRGLVRGHHRPVLVVPSPPDRGDDGGQRP